MPLDVPQSRVFWGWFSDSSAHCRLSPSDSGQGMLDVVRAGWGRVLVLSSLCSGQLLGLQDIPEMHQGASTEN